MKPPRIPMIDLDEAKARAAEVGLPPQFAELNIFRTLLHNPDLGKGIGELLLTLLFKSSLDPRLRELVIMRIGWSTASEYEWTQHWSIALEQFGCTQEDLLAVRDWQKADHFSKSERAILKITDEIVESGSLSDTTWRACTSAIPHTVTQVELVASISLWHLISQITRSLEVQLEDGVAPWPPDGHAPAF